MAQMSAIVLALFISIWRVEPMPAVRLSAPRLAPRHVKLVDAAPWTQAPRTSTNSITAPAKPVLAQITAPSHIPARTAMIIDDALPVDSSPVRSEGASGTFGLLAGGGPVFTGTVKPPEPPRPALPAKPVAKPRAPVPVGGDVRPPMAVHVPKPIYPDLARKARVSGLVRLSSIIGTDGRVRALELVSGHPLLVSAAIDAVRQWTYRPTLLNGEPVEVILMIDVNFSLAQ
jgi:protein TonB